MTDSEFVNVLLSNACFNPDSTDPDPFGWRIVVIDLCCAWYEARVKPNPTGGWIIDWIKPRYGAHPQKLPPLPPKAPDNEH